MNDKTAIRGLDVGWAVGMTRNPTAIGLTNLVTKLVRYKQIERLGLRNWRTA